MSPKPSLQLARKRGQSKSWYRVRPARTLLPKGIVLRYPNLIVILATLPLLGIVVYLGWSFLDLIRRGELDTGPLAILGFSLLLTFAVRSFIGQRIRPLNLVET